MKILILTYKYPPVHLSGLEMGSQYMAKHLTSLGHDVHVVVTRRDAQQKFHNQEDGCDVWRIPVFPIPIIRSIFEILMASVLIIFLRPDVLHGQALFPCGWLSGLWGKLLRKKSVVYLYGRDVVHPNRFLRNTLGAQSLQWNDTVLCATQHCHENAEKIYKRKMDVFYSGFEPPSIWNDSIQRSNKEILFVGRLEPVKGIDFLLRSLAKVKVDWQLKVIGTGKDRGKLKQLAIALNIDKHIQWLDRVDNRDIYTHMLQTHVFVLPSREEPYGVVLLEALAAGCYVIGSDVGGIPEIIDCPEKGQLVAVGDVEQLSEAIEKALIDQQEMQQIQKEIRTQFSWEARVKELLAHYESNASVQ